MERTLNEDIINNYWFYLSQVANEHPLIDARIVAGVILKYVEDDIDKDAKKLILSFLLS